MNAVVETSICPRCETMLAPGEGPCPSCGATRVPPGAQLLDGRWVLDRVLGKGGMGTVWLAHDIDLDRKVAVKVLAPNLASDAELLARFEREARMMGRLDHPNLVPVYSIGRRKGSPFIVMKHLEGLTLLDHLAQRGRLTPAQVLALVRQLCAGLQFMHQRDVVHRDIKPANIFIAPDGHLTLLDLGVARDSHSTMTSAGTMVGTPRYMAPEQVVGKRVDHRADLYSLAALTYELVTNEPVFHGESEHSVMKAHLASPPPDAAQVSGVSAALGAVLARGLSKKPESRFQSASEFLTALVAMEPAAIPLDTTPSTPSPLAPVPVSPQPIAAPLEPLPTGVVSKGQATRRARGPLPLVDEDEGASGTDAFTPDAVTEDHHALDGALLGPGATLEKTREMVPLRPASTLELDEERTTTATDGPRPPPAPPAAARPTQTDVPLMPPQDAALAAVAGRWAKLRALKGDAFESSESLAAVPESPTEERPQFRTGWYFALGGKTHHVAPMAFALGLLSAITVLFVLLLVLSLALRG
jgi:serine/threonine protein kinase